MYKNPLGEISSRGMGAIPGQCSEAAPGYGRPYMLPYSWDLALWAESSPMNNWTSAPTPLLHLLSLLQSDRSCKPSGPHRQLHCRAATWPAH
jgi:hypothetical protein